MTVNYRNSLKVGRMQLVLDDIDSGPSNGTLELGTSGMAIILTTFNLADPCGTVLGTGVLSLVSPLISEQSIASGAAAAARIKNSNGDIIVDGLTVGTSSSDIILDDVNISTAQVITLNTASVTHS